MPIHDITDDVLRSLMQRQKSKQAKKQTGKKANRQKSKQAKKQTGKKQTGKKANRQKSKQAKSKQAKKQTDKKANRQTDKKTKRQKDKKTARQWHSRIIMKLLRQVTEAMMETEKKNRIIDWSVFAAMLFAVSAVTLWLFYKQTTGSPALYHSDMKAYILEVMGLGSAYSFPYPLFFKLAAFFYLFVPPDMAVAIATMLLNSLAIFITKLSFNRLAASERRRGWGWRVFLSGLAVSLFFISMLYPPQGIYLPGISFNYLGVFTANPFHNATYMAARPFAILAFLWYVKLLPVYEEGIRGNREKGRDYILFSLFLLLATMTKPSFTIVLVGTAGIIMLFRLFRSGFGNFVPTLQLGLCFIPTFVDLLYQFKGVFVPKDGAEGGIGFCFGEVWAQYCENVPLAVCLAVGFPLLVLVLNYRELKENTLYRFSWQFYLMSFAMAFLLYEKGFRKFDFNFSWGYMYGIFFCHMGALLVLVRSTDEGKRKPLLAGLQWLAYLGHLVCGLNYFLGFLRGQMYY